MSEFILPNLGDGVAQGDVLKVLVKLGDAVAIDQPVLELETDKATIEVPSSVAGTVKEIKVKAGDKVKPGQAVLTFESGNGSAATPAAKAEAPKAEAPKAEASKPVAAPEPSSPAPDAPSAPDAPAEEAPAKPRASVTNIATGRPQAPAAPGAPPPAAVSHVTSASSTVGPSSRARNRRRRQPDHGHRTGRTHHTRRCEGIFEARHEQPRQQWAGGGRERHGALGECRSGVTGFCQVGRGRAQGYVRHPPQDGGTSESRVEHHSPRHAVRQGRHHV